MSDQKKILIIGETEGGVLSQTSRELLGGARRLAESSASTVELVLLGADPGGAPSEAVSCGADVVRVGKSPVLQNYEGEAWLRALKPMLEDRPLVVLLSQSAMGRDLGPRLAQRLGVGIAMDCVNLEVNAENGKVRFTRPVFGGKALAVLECRTSPQMATVRAKSVKPLEPDPARQGEVIVTDLDLDPGSLRVKVHERVEEKTEGVPLEDAGVVVSGGRGMGGPEGFDLLGDLAGLFKGAVGSSRPPCDNGWVASARQVGLTGKIIRPDLYFAVALSGSSQHMAGCQDAGVIIAINKDPDANIWSYAHYGVVDDYRKVLPPLIERLKEKLR